LGARRRRSDGLIYEFFSKRRKKADLADISDVYQYDSVPNPLRVQIQQILVDAIGPQYEIDPYAMSVPRHHPAAWEQIHKILCRELGRHRLVETNYSVHVEGVLRYLGTCSGEEFVDTLELLCRTIEIVISPIGEHARKERGIQQSPSSAIEEINYRMREAGFGFAYQDGQIYRLDSEFTHEEVIKPALRILSGENFRGAQDEFIEAHRHYRKNENEQAIVWAGKAFESALKSICEMKRWPYEKGARALDLLKVIRSHGLWPDYLDGSFDQLISTLGSGLPKMRNDAGAHGQGLVPRDVPSYVAGYAINLCAAKIVLLAEAANN
jgi:AbiJ N-terminal domain 4